MRTTQGKCPACRVAFRWEGATKLRDAACPRCGAKLVPTTYLFAGPWVSEAPTTNVTRPSTRP